MTSKYQNKYRIPTTRASWWDYGRNAAYFVTICTRNREHFFGNINNRKMHLSEIGNYAQSCWEQIPDHFPFVVLGAFVVMPNHVHGIVVINKTGRVNGEHPVVETQDLASLRRDVPSQQNNSLSQTNPGTTKTNSDPNPKTWVQ